MSFDREEIVCHAGGRGKQSEVGNDKAATGSQCHQFNFAKTAPTGKFGIRSSPNSPIDLASRRV